MNQIVEALFTVKKVVFYWRALNTGLFCPISFKMQLYSPANSFVPFDFNRNWLLLSQCSLALFP